MSDPIVQPAPLSAPELRVVLMAAEARARRREPSMDLPPLVVIELCHLALQAMGKSER